MYPDRNDDANWNAYTDRNAYIDNDGNIGYANTYPNHNAYTNTDFDRNHRRDRDPCTDTIENAHNSDFVRLPMAKRIPSFSIKIFNLSSYGA